MRRFLAWLACGTGAAFVFRWRLRRRRPSEAAAPDPAEELKRKLEESRTAEPGEQAAEPEEPQTGVDERRRLVHERGRTAIDEMRDRGAREPER
jgi:hypothetical protein